jgi:hypothetical protein
MKSTHNRWTPLGRGDIMREPSTGDGGNIPRRDIMSTMWRSRWAAVGAAIAVTLGAGGIGLVQATTSTGEKPIYKPINPCRLADTRPAPFTVGPRTSPLGPDESYTLSGWGAVGQCNLPSDTTGLALNVTALDQSAATFLTLHPTGEALPNASHLNPTPGEPPTPNAVNVDLNAAGEFNIFNKFGNVNVIVDVVGLYDDHTHDDRYYQKSETYAKSETYSKTESDTKFLSSSQDSQADVDGGTNSIPLTTTDTVVASVTVDTPTSGYVILNSGGMVWNGTATVRCSITTGSTVDLSNPIVTDTDGSREVIAGTRGFTINYGLLLQPPERTYNLVCDTAGGTATYVWPQLNAIFIPDPDAFSVIIVPFPDEQTNFEAVGE